MLTIRTEVKESKGKGSGVFSLEKISKGQTIWVENPLFYKIISYYEFNRLPNIKQDFIRKYATEYISERMFYLDLDDTRFLNHSDNPNMEWDETQETSTAIALCDINIGDEITCDYVRLNPNDSELEFIKNKTK